MSDIPTSTYFRSFLYFWLFRFPSKFSLFSLFFKINFLYLFHSFCFHLFPTFELFISIFTQAPDECPGYDIKQSNGEAPALEIWGMWSTPSLPLLPGPLWLGVIAPDRILSMGQIELFDI